MAFNMGKLFADDAVKGVGSAVAGGLAVTTFQLLLELIDTGNIIIHLGNIFGDRKGTLHLSPMQTRVNAVMNEFNISLHGSVSSFFIDDRPPLDNDLMVVISTVDLRFGAAKTSSLLMPSVISASLLIKTMASSTALEA